jgi:hemoglobin
MPPPDIATRDDIDRLLRHFYGAALEDDTIGYLFTDVAHLDLEAHLPVIGNFWEAVLLQRPVYRGNPMRQHQALHAMSTLRAEHFQRWFVLWAASVDALFSGPVADEAKRRAAIVAEAMQHQLRIESPPEQFGEAYRRALGFVATPDA